MSEQLVDTFACAGTVDDVVCQLGAFADAGLDLPLAWHTLGPDPDAALELLAGPVRAAVVSSDRLRTGRAATCQTCPSEQTC